MVDEINAAIKGIGSTHACDDAQLAVDNVNHYFGGKSLSDMAAAKVCTSEYSMFLYMEGISKNPEYAWLVEI